MNGYRKARSTIDRIGVGLALSGSKELADVNESWSRRPRLVYGLDIGIGSVGWAVLDVANRRVVALNSLIFPVPQADKTKESLASQRSAKRRHRRTLRRKRAVRRACLRLLDEYELLVAPRHENGDIDLEKGGAMMQPRKGESSPLLYRAEGLDRLLTDRELSMVVYSLCGHRGYIDQGEGDGDDAEDGKVLKALASNKSAMEDGGFRTVGEMFAATGRSRNRGGDYSLCVSNKQICEELCILFEHQRELGSMKATEELREKIVSQCLSSLTDRTAQERRTYSLVSPCLYFGAEGEKAAPKACLSSEMVNAYECLRNIRIVGGGRIVEGLQDELVEVCIDRLFSPIPGKASATRITYKWLRKRLDLSDRYSFKGIKRDDEGKRDVYAPKAWNAYRAHLPGPLLGKMRSDRHLADAIGCALAYSLCKATLHEILEGSAGTDMPVEYLELLKSLTVEEAGAVEALPYASKLFSGYGSRSLRALDVILTWFAQGAAGLAEIELATGLMAKRSEHGEPCEFLPPYVEFDPQCNNPVVLRVMSNVRAVVNALVRTYGRPAEIHVELARELKLPRSVQGRINANNNKRKNANDERRRIVAGILGCEENAVSGKTLLKMELMEEQSDKDTYTGETIDKMRLIIDDQYAQVDHIIPYSRCYDDSRANKVLVLAKTNQDKGDRSPYEWLGDGEAWDMLRARVADAKSMSARKRMLILCEDVDAETEGFISRNLNDTRYATRKAAQWLEHGLLFEGESDRGRKQHVVCPAGAITGRLRHNWGLPKKDRDKDNLHHGVDAAVIAACTKSIVQRTAIAHSKKHLVKQEEYDQTLRDALPWPGFVAEVEALAASAVPARAPRRRVTGEAFEETTYRLLSSDRGDGRAILVTGAKKEKRSGNCRIDLDEGSARIYGGLAFLQLWWDPQGKVKGKGTPGCWLADPVFYADIPNYLISCYIPRSGKKGLARNIWQPVPRRALTSSPLKLFPGDMIRVKGQLRLFVGYDIATCNWVLADVRRPYSDRKAQAVATAGFSLLSCDHDEIQLVDSAPLGFPDGVSEDEC